MQFTLGDRVEVEEGCGSIVGVIQGIAHVLLEKGNQKVVRCEVSKLREPTEPPPESTPKATVVITGEEAEATTPPAPDPELEVKTVELEDEVQVEDGGLEIKQFKPDEVDEEAPVDVPKVPGRITKKWLEETSAENLQLILDHTSLTSTREKRIRDWLDSRG